MRKKQRSEWKSVERCAEGVNEGNTERSDRVKFWNLEVRALGERLGKRAGKERVAVRKKGLGN